MAPNEVNGAPRIADGAPSHEDEPPGCSHWSDIRDVSGAEGAAFRRRVRLIGCHRRLARRLMRESGRRIRCYSASPESRRAPVVARPAPHVLDMSVMPRAPSVACGSPGRERSRSQRQLCREVVAPLRSQAPREAHEAPIGVTSSPRTRIRRGAARGWAPRRTHSADGTRRSRAQGPRGRWCRARVGRPTGLPSAARSCRRCAPRGRRGRRASPPRFRCFANRHRA